MDDSVTDDNFNEGQRSGLTERQFDQDRTLAAMHSLEAALAEAAPGREESWREAVLDALVVLGQVTTEEAENANRPDSLLSDLARTQPRLRNRVRGVRLQYGQLRETIASIRSELDGHADENFDFSRRAPAARMAPHCSTPPTGEGVRSHLRGVLRGVQGRARSRCAPTG